MTDNLFEAQYDITKKTKLRKIYEENKISIFSAITILIVIFVISSIYLKGLEKERIVLSERYIKSKVYLDNGEKNKALDLLKKTVLASDKTYSTLSFFLILDQNLINDHNELNLLFDHLLKNNKYEKELKDLIIYKKVLFNSNFAGEFKILEDIKPLLKEDNLWKPHALMLLGDYFVSKKEYSKAKDFFKQIIAMENISTDFHQQAKSRLININND